MPGLFEQFPHTNLHELNLDWLIDMINQFKEELEDSAVLSVNGQTGHVTLYESENVILPALPEGVDQWRLVRMMNGQYAGILFYNGNVYLQRGNENMRLLTLEDIPTSAGVVSWNGRTGVVNVTGMDIPVDDAADADSIEQAITNEHVERVNADNALSANITNISSLNTGTVTWNTENVDGDPSRINWFRIGKIVIASLEFTPLSGKIVNNTVICSGLPSPFAGSGVFTFGGNAQQMTINANGDLCWYYPTDRTTLNRIDITIVYIMQ